MFLDRCYHVAYRLAYPIMCRWWRLRGHRAVTMAVWVDDRVLAVRHSYKPGLRLPGGGISRREHHRDTAARELQEEVGLTIDPNQLRLVFATKGRYGALYFYEAHLDAMPVLQIDRREIIEATFLPPSQLVESKNRFITGYLTETYARLSLRKVA